MKSKAIDMIGLKFGELVVISKAKNNSDKKACWNCACNCGNELIISGKRLRSQKVENCGKHTNLKIGDIFGELTILYIDNSQKKIYCKCSCNCGNEIIVRDIDLTWKKSCGCLRSGVHVGERYGSLTILEFSHIERGFKYFLCQCDCDGNKREYCGTMLKCGNTSSCGYCDDPRILSAKNVWSKGDYKQLPFKIFYVLSQLPCHYCGETNLNSFNSSKRKFNKKDGWFRYNGIDRVDPSLAHTQINCVPCCRWCNTSKLDYSYVDFLFWAEKVFKNLYNISNNKFDIEKDLPSNKYIIGSAKNAWRQSYSELNFKIFFNLSQLNCYYCNEPPSNCSNRYKSKTNKYSLQAVVEGNFIYNGLDRIDNNLDHRIENVVPCCFQCNSAKSSRTIEKFLEWIIQLNKNVIEKQLLTTDIKIFIDQYNKQSYK